MSATKSTNTPPRPRHRPHPKALEASTRDGDLPRVTIENASFYCGRCDGPVEPGALATFTPDGCWSHYDCELAWWDAAQLRVIDGGGEGGQGVLVALTVAGADADAVRLRAADASGARTDQA